MIGEGLYFSFFPHSITGEFDILILSFLEVLAISQAFQPWSQDYFGQFRLLHSITAPFLRISLDDTFIFWYINFLHSICFLFDNLLISAAFNSLSRRWAPSYFKRCLSRWLIQILLSNGLPLTPPFMNFVLYFKMLPQAKLHEKYHDIDRLSVYFRWRSFKTEYRPGAKMAIRRMATRHWLAQDFSIPPSDSIKLAWWASFASKNAASLLPLSLVLSLSLPHDKLLRVSAFAAHIFRNSAGIITPDITAATNVCYQ